jgi:hypothetical protein
MNVRSWLRRLPQPAKVRLDRKQVVRVGEGKNKWRDVVDVILTQHPHILEALDGDGNIIRVTELEEQGDDATTADGDKRASPGPNTELAQLGALIKDSFESGAKQNREFFEAIVGKYAALAESVINRNAQLENAVERTWEERAAEIASGGGDVAEIMNGPLGVLINAVMGRMLESKKEPPTAEQQSNGKRARK